MRRNVAFASDEARHRDRVAVAGERDFINSMDFAPHRTRIKDARRRRRVVVKRSLADEHD